MLRTTQRHGGVHAHHSAGTGVGAPRCLHQLHQLHHQHPHQPWRQHRRQRVRRRHPVVGCGTACQSQCHHSVERAHCRAQQANTTGGTCESVDTPRSCGAARCCDRTTRVRNSPSPAQQRVADGRHDLIGRAHHAAGDANDTRGVSRQTHTAPWRRDGLQVPRTPTPRVDRRPRRCAWQGLDEAGLGVQRTLCHQSGACGPSPSPCPCARLAPVPGQAAAAASAPEPGGLGA